MQKMTDPVWNPHEKMNKILLDLTIFASKLTVDKLKKTVAGLYPFKGLFTCKYDFSLGLQVYTTNNIFSYAKMN
jgi:hypothetical protein